MGGAAKRMMHPYDNLDLTFNNMIDMMNQVVNGEINCYEKFDGTNLVWCVDNEGQPRYARKVGQTLTGGLSYDEFLKSLKGHPVEHIFSSGARAVKELTFAHGSPTIPEKNTWVNSEILLKDNPQMIKYDHDSIVLHKLVVPVRDSENKLHLADVTSDYTRKWQLFIMRSRLLGLRNWKVRGPQKMKVAPMYELASNTRNDLDSIALAANVDLNSSLRDFVYTSTVHALICVAAVSEDHAHQLAENVVGRGKHNIRTIKGHYSKYVCDWIDKIALSKNRDKWINNVMMPVKKCWELFGASLLSETDSTMIKDSKSARERLKSLVEWNKSKLDKKYKESHPKVRDNFYFQLRRFEALNVEPPVSEGLVFSFERNTYKLTGAFPSLNRVTGAVRYEIGEMYNEKTSN